jgi:hypothetical protein
MDRRSRWISPSMLRTFASPMLLDAYTTLLPAALESSLEELKALFDARRGCA